MSLNGSTTEVHRTFMRKATIRRKIQIANDEQYQEIELLKSASLFSSQGGCRDNLTEGICYMTTAVPAPARGRSQESVETDGVNHTSSVL